MGDEQRRLQRPRKLSFPSGTLSGKPEGSAQPLFEGAGLFFRPRFLGGSPLPPSRSRRAPQIQLLTDVTLFLTMKTLQHVLEESPPPTATSSSNARLALGKNTCPETDSGRIPFGGLSVVFSSGLCRIQGSFPLGIPPGFLPGKGCPIFCFLFCFPFVLRIPKSFRGPPYPSKGKGIFFPTHLSRAVSPPLFRGISPSFHWSQQ